jgi:hypothetical protein
MRNVRWGASFFHIASSGQIVALVCASTESLERLKRMRNFHSDDSTDRGEDSNVPETLGTGKERQNSLMDSLHIARRVRIQLDCLKMTTRGCTDESRCDEVF